MQRPLCLLIIICMVVPLRASVVTDFWLFIFWVLFDGADLVVHISILLSQRYGLVEISP